MVLPKRAITHEPSTIPSAAHLKGRTNFEAGITNLKRRDVALSVPELCYGIVMGKKG